MLLTILSSVLALSTVDPDVATHQSSDVSACLTQGNDGNTNPDIIHISSPVGELLTGEFRVLDKSGRYTFEVYCGSDERLIALCNLGPDSLEFGDPRASYTTLPANNCATGDFYWLRVRGVSSSSTGKVEFAIVGKSTS